MSTAIQQKTHMHALNGPQDWSYRKPRRGIKRLRGGDVVRVFYTDPEDAALAYDYLDLVGVVVGRAELPGASRRDPAYEVAFPGVADALWWNELEILRRAPRPVQGEQFKRYFPHAVLSSISAEPQA